MGCRSPRGRRSMTLTWAVKHGLMSAGEAESVEVPAETIFDVLRGR
jgi:hypothetical protein